MTSQGGRGREIFGDEHDRDLFLRMLELVRSHHGWGCSAYCLMTTHYHLIVRLRDANLAVGMAVLNGRYAAAFNARYETHGHLFAARYYAGHLATDAHLLEAHRYVALNPVRAGLVDRPEEWTWSSFRFVVAAEGPRACLIRLDDRVDSPVGTAVPLFRQFVEDRIVR